MKLIIIGFGSDYEFFSNEPLEYNKKNIKDMMEKVKNLGADKGGTELYEPLKKIYTDEIYNKFDMKKNIILLTDGELFDKQKVLNLIGANSSKFSFNSIGICDCDRDLIERTALMGNGFSYYISNLNELNKIVISLLEKTKSHIDVSCKINQKCFIENNNKFFINKNDFFKYGFILEGKDIKNNIEFEYKMVIIIKIKKNNFRKIKIFDVRMEEYLLGGYDKEKYGNKIAGWR